MAGYASLNQFISHVKQHGMLTASHFHVIIGGSPGGEINTRDVMMMCESTNLPGLNIFTNEIRIFGESRSTPYSISYSELSMNFILDRSLKVKQYFEDWTNQVFNRETRKLGYYNDYTKDIEIYISDRTGKPAHALKLFECYPKSIGDIGLDYNSHDILRLPVQIVYKYWENIHVGNINNRRNTIFNLTGGNIPAELSLAPGESIVTGNPGGGINLDWRDEHGLPLTSAGLGISGSLPRLFNSASAAANSSSLPATVGSNMSGLSVFTNNLGSGITQLGRSLSAITAPVSAISGAVGGIASTLGQFDNTLNAMGIGRPFSHTVNRLNGVSGSIAVISSVNGVPGQLSSLGGVMTGASGAFSQTARALESVPAATQRFRDSLNRIGGSFSTNGSVLANASNQLQSDLENSP